MLDKLMYKTSLGQEEECKTLNMRRSKLRDLGNIILEPT